MRTFKNNMNGLYKYRFSIIVISILFFLFSSCYKETTHKIPEVAMPDKFDTKEDRFSIMTDREGNLEDLFWWEFVQDDTLKELIRTAVVHNYDVRIAAARIEQAQAAIGIKKADQLPIISGAAEYQGVKASRIGTTPIPAGTPDQAHQFSVGAEISYVADFWGKYRKSTQSAIADMLAAREYKNVVLMTLVSDVTTAYFNLLELDMEKEICLETLKSREESLTLVKAREEGGVATMLDVDQALSLYYQAQTQLISVEQQIEAQEHNLNLLLGTNSRGIVRGLSLEEQLKMPPIPPGLPSSILYNRPDIRRAEYQLFAADLNIDVARTYYFPEISLTGQGGTSSRDLVNLFTGPSYTWSFIPQMTFPIFEGGKIKSQVEQTQALQKEAVAQYEKTVQTAFKEVADALSGYARATEYLAQQQKFTDTLKDQSELANLRYEAGVTSYLEVLDTERQYFDAELALAKAKLSQYSYVINLYKALGGGWRQEPETPSLKKAEKQEENRESTEDKDKAGD